MKRPSNKPRDELIHLAHEAISMNGGRDVARVWFKFDCGTCGSRETAPTPNELPPTGTCNVCGAVSKIRGGGFALERRRSTAVDWDHPERYRTLLIRKAYDSDKGDA